MAGMQLRGYLLHFLVADFSDINLAPKKVSAENALVTPQTAAFMQWGSDH